jgi:pimeloyl-ACP methyl ester carboxylesterase
VSLEQAQARFDREAERRHFDTGRYRCHYFVWGQGPPLLMIPGLADTALSFLYLAAHLADQFRCIAYDLPQGRDDGARLPQYTHRNLVADFWALLDHLSLGQSYVLASSYGSMIALEAARAEPARLPRLVLQGGFAYRPLALAEWLLAGVCQRLPGRLSALPLRSQLLLVHQRPFRRVSEDVWKLFAVRADQMPIQAIARHALLLHAIDLRANLAQVPQPVLLVSGDLDPLVSRHCEDVLLGGLPNCLHAEIAECGHFPLFTHPDILADLVVRFLKPSPQPFSGLA